MMDVASVARPSISLNAVRRVPILEAEILKMFVSLKNETRLGRIQSASEPCERALLRSAAQGNYMSVCLQSLRAQVTDEKSRTFQQQQQHRLRGEDAALSF